MRAVIRLCRITALVVFIGGQLGRKKGSVKTANQKREEYREVIEYLKKGYTIRNVAKLYGKGVSTAQRWKKEFVGIILY